MLDYTQSEETSNLRRKKKKTLKLAAVCESEQWMNITYTTPLPDNLCSSEASKKSTTDGIYVLKSKEKV